MVSSTARRSKACHVSQAINYQQSVLYAHLDHLGESFQLKTVRLLRTELSKHSTCQMFTSRLQLSWRSKYLCDRQHCRACMTTLCVERQRLEIYRVAGWIDQRHIRALCCNRKHTAIQPESVLLRKLSRKLAGQRTQSATTWPLVQDEFAITTSARRPTSP